MHIKQVLLTVLLGLFLCHAALAQKTSVPAGAGLDARVREAISPFAGRVSLYAKNLDTGADYGLGADTRVQTASTIKVPIMAEAFAQVAAGKVKWDDPLTLTGADKQGGTGVLYEFHDGLHLTLRDAVTLMIVLSDNTAANLVLDRLTTDAVNARMDALGLPAIRSLEKIGGGGDARAASEPANKDFGIGVATPRAMAALLEQMARGKVVSPEASREMLALLRRQQQRYGIGRDLQGVEIANKPGALDHLRSDVGILYTKRGRIVLAITCDQMPRSIWTVDNPAYLLISRLSGILADGLGK